MSKTNLFKQFTISVSTQFQCEKQFYFKQFILAQVHSLFLTDPLLSPYQVLLLQVIVDLGEMAMKGYTTFPKAPALLEPHHQIF